MNFKLYISQQVEKLVNNKYNLIYFKLNCHKPMISYQAFQISDKEIRKIQNIQLFKDNILMFAYNIYD